MIRRPPISTRTDTLFPCTTLFRSALFPEAVDVRIADLADRVGLAKAITGSRVIHYIPPVFNAAEEAFGASVIAAAMDAGAARLCYHSVLHASTPAMPHHIRKSRVELALRESQIGRAHV